MISKTLTRWIDWILVNPMRHLFEKPEKVLKDYVKEGMTVLDVGCGEGFYSIRMARLVGPQGRVVCVDTRAEAIESLKERAAEAELLPLIEPRVCSEEDLAIADVAHRIDFAVGVYVVHHATDAVRLMRDVYRALRPGGTFLVIEPRHHASARECEATEAAAREAGFAIAGHPKLRRDWSVSLEKVTRSGGEASS